MIMVGLLLIKILSKSLSLWVMCTNKILIRSNSRFISTVESPQVYRYVNCGYCAECMTQKLNEWQLRIYYQTQECLSKGGYVYIDCLTYSPQYLPRLNRFFDVSFNYAYKCFDSNDVRLFLVNLREKLYRLGYGRKCFTYYYVGEFGENFTKRPHYHILFFVNAPINNAAFSLLVSSTWYQGRTDGLFYQGYNKLNYNTISLANSDNSRISAISNYIAKYLHKSLKLIHLAYRKAKTIINAMFGITKIDELSYSQKLLFRAIKSKLQPFQRCSKGFGLYALSCVPLDFIIKEQKMFFNYGSNIRFVSVPMYYVRKLFFDCKKNYFGALSWTPNIKYLEYIKYAIPNKIEGFAQNIRALCYQNKIDFPMDYHDFAICWYYVFGRVNYRSVSASIDSDLNADVDKAILNDGYFNYTHAKYGLNVLSTHELLIPLTVGYNRNHKPIKINKYGKKSEKAKTLDFDTFALSVLDSSWSALSNNGFSLALPLFLSAVSKKHESKIKALDSQIKISQTLKNLSYVGFL